ncbi:hypothetical protein HF263_26745 [Rhizobium leguminosarum]|uniref:hypothetical protein n=1 Tax=Rhizobium TaxID=379 RepID=UPI001C8376DC|nr:MULTISPECIES: hypothetical protein [Rhizobium]MBX5177222.1 hypothetical protein [Rhizobium lentis]MBY2994861.1 hypothetical protein [Rhizobium leguminosarum]MBY3059632.1 hypothetical protein [Rhizobium leguminosarum]MBY3143229.1 hypothetical protein [Rhizobium laguerreae]
MGDTLIAEDHDPIGLDHFHLPDDELALAQKAGQSRVTFGYSADTSTTVIGFGASAIGRRLGDGYTQDELQIRPYCHVKGHTSEDRLAIVERRQRNYIPAVACFRLDPVSQNSKDIDRMDCSRYVKGLRC